MEKKEALKIVQESGIELENLPKELKKDKQIVLEAVKNRVDALQYAHNIFKKDKELVLEVIKQNGHALYYVDDSFKKDKEIVLIAVKEDGSALEHADDSFKKDKEIVLIAVKQDGSALEHADDSFKKDKEIVLIAVKQDLNALKYANKSFKKKINTSFINFKKLKKDMDNDADFLHWDTDEKVSITHTGSGNETNYRVSVESNQDEDTSEYDVYGEFASSVNEIESAVKCFIENGGDILSFHTEGYLNVKKILIELKKT
mgnify:CR=1 FL=1